MASAASLAGWTTSTSPDSASGCGESPPGTDDALTLALLAGVAGFIVSVFAGSGLTGDATIVFALELDWTGELSANLEASSLAEMEPRLGTTSGTSADAWISALGGRSVLRRYDVLGIAGAGAPDVTHVAAPPYFGCVFPCAALSGDFSSDFAASFPRMMVK